MTKTIIDYIGSGRQRVNLSVKRDQSLIYMLVGTKPGTKEVTVKLRGERARAQILGFFLGREGQGEMKTLQHHEAPNTESDLLIKSVLFDRAKYNYQGQIRIDKKAQGANAYQRNDNLLMSDKAQIDTRPELEILADDVRCTHGATTGKINEENLFYLMSRGISRKIAELMIMEGFLKEVIDKIPDGKEKTKLVKKLEKELTK